MAKIAIIHNIITPYRLELFEKLSKHSCISELHVFYCLKKYKSRAWEFNYDTEYKSKILPGYTFILPLIKLPCSINPSIFNEICKNKYDAVIICGFTDITSQLAYISCKMWNIPIILWSELSGNYLFKYHKLYNRFIKLFIKSANALIVPSTKSKQYHIDMGAIENAIFISPNTVNGKKYSDKVQEFEKKVSLIKKELSITTQKNILFVGRFIKLKSINNLIKAFARIKSEFVNVGLILVGDGPEKNYLSNFCIINGIKDVYFTGFINDENLKIKYYSISDIFVLPSSFELHPLVLPEAMACSLPVISTKVVANAGDLIVEGKNGYVISEENIEQLYSAIKKILLDDNAKLMGVRSLQILNERCSLDIAVEGIVNSIDYVTYVGDQK